MSFLNLSAFIPQAPTANWQQLKDTDKLNELRRWINVSFSTVLSAKTTLLWVLMLTKNRSVVGLIQPCTFSNFIIAGEVLLGGCQRVSPPGVYTLCGLCTGTTSVSCLKLAALNW